MRLALLPLLLVVLVAGCASGASEKPRQVFYRACPTRLVEAAIGNQMAVDSVDIGVTHFKELKTLGNPAKVVDLVRNGSPPMKALFYPTRVPGCPLMDTARPVHEPMVIDSQGLIVALGYFGMRDLAAQGWKLKTAQFSWMDYNFAYLPSR